jgi:deoxyribonuclease V
MNPVLHHPWDVPPQAARELQSQLAERVVRHNQFEALDTVAGVDVCCKDRWACAAVVVLSFPDLTPLVQAITRQRVTFPYVPGLLGFREGPVMIEAIRQLAYKPDVLIVDGQGIAHPRRCGLASHLGVLLDVPSIGCAKSWLRGQYTPPNPQRGASAPLVDHDEVLGAVLRTRSNVKPVYVSLGHRIDLPTSIRVVLACSPIYRVPETIRRAHRMAAAA